MIDLASGNLYQNPARGDEFLTDVTWAMWPTYRRQSKAMGGDWAAGFTVGGGDNPVDDTILEDWFFDHLGALFVESYDGRVTFKGLINSMRLSYRGDVHTITLDGMANKIACWYSPGQGQPATLTSFYSDAESIARYGTKTLILSPRGYLSASAAAQRAQAKLAQVAWPRSIPGDLGPYDGGRGQLEVEIIGLARTLDWDPYNSTDTGTENASTAVTNTLSGAEFVSAGTIESNTTQVAIAAEYQGRWERIEDIAENDDSGEDERWLAGCYASDELDYYQSDETAVTYWRSMKNRERITYDEDGTTTVPAPLVEPGKILYIQDAMAGQPQSSSLRQDPRAAFIESVRYDSSGVRLSGGRLRGRDIVAGTRMALRQALASQKRRVR